MRTLSCNNGTRCIDVRLKCTSKLFNVNINTSSEKAQVVDFSDQNPGYDYVVPSMPDATFRSAQKYDASLEEFFSRPVKIASYTWSNGVNLYQKFNPWKLFWENPRVINRISNYYLLRSKLCVKIVINGTGFHFGRLIASYIPLDAQDNLTVDRAFYIQDVVQASQRPHIYLDPTMSLGGQLTLPFFYYKDALSVPEDEWDQLGSMIIHTIAPLRHANGGSTDVTINVFAWAENVEMAIPTSTEPGTIVPQSGFEPQSGDSDVSPWRLWYDRLDPRLVHLVDACNTPSQLENLLLAGALYKGQWLQDPSTPEIDYIRSLRTLPPKIAMVLFESAYNGAGNFVRPHAPPDPPSLPERVPDTIWEYIPSKNKEQSHWKRKSFEPQSGDEYGDGPISKIASVANTWSAALIDAPMIGPYMRATELATGAVAQIARMFGYSKPAQIEPAAMVAVNPFSRMANGNVDDQVEKLSLDVKQELTIDSRTVGLDGTDEMSISSLVTRESFLTTFDWTTAQTSETLLFTAKVTPSQWSVLSSEIHPTPGGYLSAAFDYWRGTIDFRFMVISSNFHRGRIKIVFEPYIVASNEYNTNYTYVCDIASEKDFTVSIGWASPYGWLLTDKPNTATVQWQTSSYGTAFSRTANGVISVYVVNELTAPGISTLPDVDNNVKVAVFTSCGRDLEFAAPSNSIQDYCFFPQSGIEMVDYSFAGNNSVQFGSDDFVPELETIFEEVEDVKVRIANFSRVNTVRATLAIAIITSLSELVRELRSIPLPVVDKLVPQSGVDEQGVAEDTTDPSAPMHVQVDDALVAGSAVVNNTVYMGESIPSLRSLIKRYSMYFVIGPISTGQRVKILRHQHFPLYRGGAPDAFFDTDTLDKTNYVYMTLLNYIVPMFAGYRGGIRWKFISANGGGTNKNTYYVERIGEQRGSAKFGISEFAVLGPDSTAQYFYEHLITGPSSGAAGCALVANATGDGISFESPHYMTYRMAPAKRMDVNDSDYPFNQSWRAHVAYNAAASGDAEIKILCAGAEDFSCFFFSGCPILYRRTSYPLPL